MTEARPKYRIQTVAEMTGVPAATLRAWEQRYGVPAPERTTSSYRLYSDADVELIRRVRAMNEQGIAPSEAARLVMDDRSAADRATHDDDPFEESRRTILRTVDRYEPIALERELDRAAALATPDVVVDRVLRPVMTEIGDGWHAGTITIAQEHLASELVTRVVHRLLSRAQPTTSARVVLLACFADELHALPLHLLAVQAATMGLRAVVLGARTSPAALKDAVVRLAPSVVALSTTLALEPHRARELVDGYADACGEARWLVGGAGAKAIASFVDARGGQVAETLSHRQLRARATKPDR